MENICFEIPRGFFFFFPFVSFISYFIHDSPPSTHLNGAWDSSMNIFSNWSIAEALLSTSHQQRHSWAMERAKREEKKCQHLQEKSKENTNKMMLMFEINRFHLFYLFIYLLFLARSLSGSPSRSSWHFDANISNVPVDSISMAVINFKRDKSLGSTFFRWFASLPHVPFWEMCNKLPWNQWWKRYLFVFRWFYIFGHFLSLKGRFERFIFPKGTWGTCQSTTDHRWTMDSRISLCASWPSRKHW